MRPDQLVDSVQTAGIIVIAILLSYVVVRLERAINVAAAKLKDAMTTQSDLTQTTERMWKRLEAVERLVWERNEILPTAKLRLTLDEIRGRLDQLEAKNESPPIDH